MCDVYFHRPEIITFRSKSANRVNPMYRKETPIIRRLGDNACVDKPFIFRSVCYPQQLLSVFHSNVCVHRGYLDIPVVVESLLVSTREIIRNLSAWVPRNDNLALTQRPPLEGLYMIRHNTRLARLLLLLLLLRDNGVEIFKSRAANVSPRTGQYCRRAF